MQIFPTEKLVEFSMCMSMRLIFVPVTFKNPISGMIQWHTDQLHISKAYISWAASSRVPKYRQFHLLASSTSQLPSSDPYSPSDRPRLTQAHQLSDDRHPGTIWSWRHTTVGRAARRPIDKLDYQTAMADVWSSRPSTWWATINQVVNQSIIHYRPPTKHTHTRIGVQGPTQLYGRQVS